MAHAPEARDKPRLLRSPLAKRLARDPYSIAAALLARANSSEVEQITATHSTAPRILASRNHCAFREVRA